ncbi:hypothetical protein ACNF42_01905 [Cuniculiplasma sp. SKW3]|uniref:hypothetical protein n=1 Tax=Cuniculiplasma sp. SKW3 TaxID=3400170 RepID=UPI003FD5C297
MITAKFILSLLSKILLAIELGVSQFIWKIDINQGIFSKSDYLIWSIFSNKVFRIEAVENLYLPYIAMITGLITALQLLMSKTIKILDKIQQLSVAGILTICGIYIIRYVLELVYYSVLISTPYLNNLTYYFSDLFVVNQIKDNVGSSNSYALIFFSSIYTISGIELGLFLMLRIGVLIASYFFLPLFSFLVISQRGRGFIIKLWLLFFETALLPLMLIPLFYIYINLVNDIFAQLGILIFITAIPGIFSFGIYRTASIDYNSLPFIAETFSTKSTIQNFSDFPKLVSETHKNREKNIMNDFPETNLERLLGGND